MKKNAIPAEALRALHADRRAAIRARLAEFKAVPRTEYFYELVYCLLTPQSSARHAGAAVGLLREARFERGGVDAEPYLRRPDCYIRFHRTKARRLDAARGTFAEIAGRLGDGADGTELRAWLAANVTGLGWKEASHFLRNIGYRDLAILDRHILKNLVRVGAIGRIPATLTPKRYLAIERKFRHFAAQTGIPLDELDLLFWSLETGEILK